MFNNLIESTSHAREFKRRGSFLLFTSATYIVLFVITGVVSIYAYDARLEEQTLEIVTLLPPQEIVPDPPQPAERPDRPRETSNTSRVAERAVAMLGVDHPEIVPEKVSAAPNKNLPLPPGGAIITGRDFNPESIAGPGSPSGGGREVVQPRTVVTIPDQPPPPPEPPKPPKIVSKGVINGNATFLPKPIYPEFAKRAGVQGSVSVQVLVDLDGKVVSAKAVNGHPLLVLEAQRAALRARFSPTLLSDQPVKVSGVITYNFVLGH